MRKFNYIIASLLIVTTAISCDALVGDPDLPIPLDETLDNTGAFLRVLSVQSSGFDVADLSTANYAFTGEIQDVNNGADVESVSFFVSFNPAGTARDVAEPATALKTYTASQFTAQASGLPGGTFQVDLNEILTYLGLAVADLQLGDNFDIRWVLTTSDDTEYTNSDASPAVTGGFYQSPYFARASVVQSIPTDIFVGDYTLSQTSNGATFNPLFGTDETITLALNPGNLLNGRTANVGHLPQFGFGVFFDINITFFRFQDFQAFVAGDNYVTLSGRANGPLSCGIGLSFDPLIDANQSGFDVNDDSSFTMILTDNPLGDCGGAPAPVTFTATKN